MSYNMEQEAELRGSILNSVCICCKRNGLQDTCQMSRCMGRSSSLTNPEPQYQQPAAYMRQERRRSRSNERRSRDLTYSKNVPRILPGRKYPAIPCTGKDCRQIERRNLANDLLKYYRPLSEYTFEPRTGVFQKDDRCFEMVEIDCEDLERYDKTGVIPKHKSQKKFKNPIGR